VILPPLALYVHLPWCVRKCPYCDFNSYELRGSVCDESRSQPPELDYIAALMRDLDVELPGAAGRSLESVFIGGGTPSLFSGRAIATLLDGIRDRVAVGTGVEITLEANPGAAEAQRFADYRAAGVNRISIGVQSFRDAALSRLGRVHNAADAERAISSARRAGFDNLNVDLMYGLPGDRTELAVGDLEQALALEPTHLSWYQLTLEPQTHFARFPPDLPGDEIVDEIEIAGRERLAAAGFERYEVSAYARPGNRCRHNLNYWRFGDYLGIGAGAHGKLTLGDGRGIERRSKSRNPRSYLATAGTESATAIERVARPDALISEFLMNSLRLVDGVDTELLVERTGQTVGEIARGLSEAQHRGWLWKETDRLKATPAGMQALNAKLEKGNIDPFQTVGETR
jgi:putative oxygen-independent coproporphyrinogen III oxidase